MASRSSSSAAAEVLAAMRCDVTMVWRTPLGPPPSIIAPLDGSRAGLLRRAEFHWGRACAYEALAELGVVGPILRRGRAPIWPVGAIGSITHCSGLVGAAVGKTQTLAGLGIDAEPRRRAGLRIATQISSPCEAAWLNEDLVERPTILWCAKEAAFKCAATILGHPLRFLDIELQLDDARQTFVFKAGSALGADPLHRRASGWYALDERFVVAACAISA